MNWRELMTRVRSWLKPDGRFFMHIFTHRSGAYLFDRADGEDWIAQHFFTGGVMPSHHLIRQYRRSVHGREGMALERHALPAHRAGLACAISIAHRDDDRERCLQQRLWRRRPACGCGAGAGSSSRPRVCFGYADGSEWGVSHYRMKAA